MNDVVLATVAGAMQRFLTRRGTSTSKLNFRVAIPVNVRTADEIHILGNRVSVWLTQLPLEEPDPRRRLAWVSKTTAELKESGRAAGTDTLMKLVDWAGPALVAAGTRFASRVSPYNLIITNVPGPQFAMYFLDARLLEAYPLVPLFDNQGLGIALFSYDDRMFWGLNADWDLVPDVGTLVSDVEASFAELRALAKPCGRQLRPRSGAKQVVRRRRAARAGGT